MDSWEFNKIAAAVLAALLVIFGGSTLIDVLHASHGDHGKAGYTLPVEVASAGDTGQETEKKSGPDFAEVYKVAASADAAAGEAVFNKCKACHTANEGGKNGVGPNLWNIVNREKAHVEGFNYSKAMKERGGEWTYENLAHFIYAPKKWLRGTKMAFAGLKDPNDLGSLLAYLRTLSASPAPIPEVPAEKTEAPAAEKADAKPADAAADAKPAAADAKPEGAPDAAKPADAPAEKAPADEKPAETTPPADDQQPKQ